MSSFVTSRTRSKLKPSQAKLAIAVPVRIARRHAAGVKSASPARTPISPDGQQAILGRLGGLLNGFEQVDTNTARALRKDVHKYLETAGIIANEQESQMPQMPVDASMAQPPAPENAPMPEEAMA